MEVADAMMPREDKEVQITNQPKRRENIPPHPQNVSQLLNDVDVCKEISVRVASQLQQFHH